MRNTKGSRRYAIRRRARAPTSGKSEINVFPSHRQFQSHRFSPAVQFSTMVNGTGVESPARVLTRKRWPSPVKAIAPGHYVFRFDVPRNDARCVRGYHRAGRLTRYLEDLK